MKTVWQRLVLLNGCHIGWGYSYPYASQDSGGIFVWILLTWWTNLGNFIAIIISQWPKKCTALFISKMLLTGLARLGFQGCLVPDVENPFFWHRGFRQSSWAGPQEHQCCGMRAQLLFPDVFPECYTKKELTRASSVQFTTAKAWAKAWIEWNV